MVVRAAQVQWPDRTAAPRRRPEPAERRARAALEDRARPPLPEVVGWEHRESRRQWAVVAPLRSPRLPTRAAAAPARSARGPFFPRATLSHPQPSPPLSSFAL